MGESTNETPLSIRDTWHDVGTRYISYVTPGGHAELIASLKEKTAVELDRDINQLMALANLCADLAQLVRTIRGPVEEN